MRKSYHMCIASHDEVICRNEEDMIKAFNSLAIAIVSTESRLLGEGIMSDHMHSVFQSDDAKETISLCKYIYSRYFSSKYERHGRFGERFPFVLELEGVKHITTAVSYVLRQAVHHGICSTPFGYQHCSANSIFKKELGKESAIECIPKRTQHSNLPRAYSALMDNYRMDKNGLLVRDDVVDVKYVEELYITPRNFLFQMNRLSSEEWEKEQQAEPSRTQSITLQAIESGVSSANLEKMLINEGGRIDNSWINDIELCSLIDNVYLPQYYPKTVSIYSLTQKQREQLANRIVLDFKTNQQKNGRRRFCTEQQLIRCLALKHE